MEFHFYFVLTIKMTLLLIAIQNLEYFSLKKIFSINHLYQDKNIIEEFKFLPSIVYRFYQKMFSYNGTLMLLILRTTLIIYSFIHLNPYVFLFLLFTSMLITQRFLGAFNGGSDYMNQITLLTITLTLFLKDTRFEKVGAYYLCIQVIISYFVAGWVKIIRVDWLKGHALLRILHSINYSPPIFIKNVISTSLVSRIFSLIFIFWEITFPILLLPLPKSIKILYLFFGALFHFFNFLMFGLNRFFFAWLATYPIVYYCSTNLFV